MSKVNVSAVINPIGPNPIKKNLLVDPEWQSWGKFVEVAGIRAETRKVVDKVVNGVLMKRTYFLKTVPGY